MIDLGVPLIIYLIGLWGLTFWTSSGDKEPDITIIGLWPFVIVYFIICGILTWPYYLVKRLRSRKR